MTGEQVTAPVTAPADERAVRLLVGRFADAVNAQDMAAVAALFVDDAVLDVPSASVVGPGAISAAVGAAIAKHARLFQLLFNGEVTVQGHRAEGRWQVAEVAGEHAGGTWIIFGRWLDELVRTPEGWRFARRRFEPQLEITGASGYRTF